MTGVGNFANPDFQATFNPHVLDQCQKTGIEALVKTIELAATKQRFVTIVQGTKEPFLQFVEKLSVSLEKQVEDANLRALLLRQLANTDCRRVIEAGAPSLPDMVQACANISTTDCKMASLATVLPSSLKGPKGKQQKQVNAQANKKQGKQKQKGKTPLFLCGRCGKPYYCAEACMVKLNANGKPLPDSGNGKPSTRGNTSKHKHFPRS